MRDLIIKKYKTIIDEWNKSFEGREDSDFHSRPHPDYDAMSDEQLFSSFCSDYRRNCQL